LKEKKEKPVAKDAEEGTCGCGCMFWKKDSEKGSRGA
jgi:hypothetical protein